MKHKHPLAPHFHGDALRSMPLSEAMLTLLLQRRNAGTLGEDEVALNKAIEAEADQLVERETGYSAFHVLDAATTMFERVDQALEQVESRLCNKRLDAVENLIEEHLVDLLGWFARIRAARRTITEAATIGATEGNA